MRGAARHLAVLAASLSLVAAASSSAHLNSILDKLASNPLAPSGYTANVQVRMHLRIFPWITRTVSGTEVYKHPGLYKLAFRDAPKSLDQISGLEDDLADPQGWPQRYDISLLVPPSAQTEPVIRLVPKVHKLVKTLDISVNMAKAHIDKAVWTRYDGGTITMMQKFNTVAAHEVVSEQDADVRIPNMSADVTATYSNFSVDSGGTH